MKSSLAFLLTVLLSDYAFSARPLGLAAGLGVLPYNMFRVSNTDDGGPSIAGEYYLPIHVRGYLGLTDKWSLSPHTIYTPLGPESRDGNYKSRIFYVSLPVSYQYERGKDVSFGVGYMIRSLFPKGGTASVSTGGVSGTFGVPSFNQNLSNYYFEIGMSHTRKRINGSFDILFTNFFSKERSLSILLTVNYHLLGGWK